MKASAWPGDIVSEVGVSFSTRELTRCQCKPVLAFARILCQSASNCEDGFENERRDRAPVLIPLLIEESLVEHRYVGMNVRKVKVEVVKDSLVIRHKL